MNLLVDDEAPDLPWFDLKAEPFWTQLMQVSVVGLVFYSLTIGALWWLSGPRKKEQEETSGSVRPPLGDGRLFGILGWIVVLLLAMAVGAGFGAWQGSESAT
jgi:hypothetical protein